MTDTEKMLIGVCRAYVAAKELFGYGTETWVKFPFIQGLSMDVAISQIATIDDPLEDINPRAVADLLAAKAKEATS